MYENQFSGNSIRVAYENWIDQNRFSDLLSLLKKYPCAISTVSLFTSCTHSPLTYKEMERRVGIIKDRLDVLRKNGYEAGINILATIGHHPEDLDFSFSGDYFHATGEKGDVCLGSYCMNDENYINDYVIPVYRLLAKANPDHIWTDDDVRYGHIPVGYSCYCDKCIEKFNRLYSFSFTRESLIEALNADNYDLRKKWLDANSEKIANLLKVIFDTVRSINPAIKLGYMTGERYMEGYEFEKFAYTLSGGGKYEIMWRPGGGAYEDYRFDDIVEKSEQIARQCAYLPKYVTRVQSEIENFPYQLIKKTPTSTAIEAAWNMTAGCTGAAFNILPSETGEPVSQIVPHLDKINQYSRFFGIISEKTKKRMPYGICAAWRKDYQALADPCKFNSARGSDISAFAREMFDFGLPQGYNPENSPVLLVTDKYFKGKSDDEINKILSGGVYADASAIDYLCLRGFEDMIGFKTADEYLKDARECYTNHELNGENAGLIRNGRHAFNKGESFGILPTDEKSEIVSSLIDYHDNVIEKCSLGIFENGKNGRICAAGYYPFTWVSDYAKTIQLKNIMVYLSSGELPSFVKSYCRIRNHTFVSDLGISVILLNPTNEPLADIEVAVRGKIKEAKIYDLSSNCTVLLPNPIKTIGYDYSVFTVPKINPYEMVILDTEKERNE